MAACPQFEGKGILVHSMRHANGINDNEMMRSMTIMAHLNIISRRLKDTYGIGLQLDEVITTEDCPLANREMNRLNVRWTSIPLCSFWLETADSGTGNKNYARMFPFLITHSHSTQQIKERMDQLYEGIVKDYGLNRILRGQCNAVQQSNFLVDIKPTIGNGIREDGEECDSIVIKDQYLPCDSGKLDPNWTIQYTCANTPPCSRGGAPHIECKKASMPYSSDRCSTLIDYSPPPIGFPEFQRGVCINAQCNKSQIAWGVSFFITGSNQYTFTPWSEIKDDSVRYGCSLPIKNRTPVCYSRDHFVRPEGTAISCGVSIQSGRSREWLPYHDSACAGLAEDKPSDSCDHARVNAQYGKTLPPCLGYQCAPSNLYPTSLPSIYQRYYKQCSNQDPDYGFNTQDCTINQGAVTRHVGCYNIDQTDSTKFPLYVELDVAECEKQVGPNTWPNTKPSTCGYDWECPPGNIVQPQPSSCPTCDDLPCSSRQFSTDPVCVWRDQYTSGLITNPSHADVWCGMDDKPPGVHTVCSQCEYLWGCSSPIQSSTVDCTKFNFATYECIPDDNGVCGDGKYDSSNITVKCMSKQPVTGILTEAIDPSRCTEASRPTFECTKECINDWKCITTATTLHGERTISALETCNIDTIQETVENSQQFCGEVTYKVQLTCPPTSSCHVRPDGFPPGTDIVEFVLKNTVTCRPGCYDLNKATYKVGDVILLTDVLPCGEWANDNYRYIDQGGEGNTDNDTVMALPLSSPVEYSMFTCSTDDNQPCQIGRVRREAICVDFSRGTIIRILSETKNEGDSFYCSSLDASSTSLVFESPCLEYDPQTCTTLQQCSFDYTEQYYLPTQDQDIPPPFAAEYHSFTSENCSIESWDPILADRDAAEASTAEELRHPGACGKMVKVSRCFLTPLPNGGNNPTDDSRDIWFPDQRFCTSPTSFPTDRRVIYAFKPEYSLPAFSQYNNAAYNQQQIALQQTFYEGCSRWRCSRSLQGNPTSNFYSVNYCYDEPTICDTDPIVTGNDRCAVYGLMISQQCYYPPLITADGRDVGTATISSSHCHRLQKPVDSATCTYMDQCASIRRECGFDAPSFPFAAQVCQDTCKTPLCGDHTLYSACFATARGAGGKLGQRTQVPLSYCEAQEGFDPTPLPEKCENYMGCTHWACSAWSNGVDPDAVNAGVVPLSELSEDQCSTLPSASLVRSMCSVPCGRGVIQRHVACISDGKIVPDHESHSRCGLHHVRPAHALPCKTEPRNCSAMRECNISNRPLSYETCSWSASPDSCPSICGSDSGDDDDDNGNNGDGNNNNGDEDGTPVDKNYAVDITTRCVYRGTGAMLFAPPSKCMTDNVLSKPKSCPRTKDACCQSQGGSTPFDSTTNRIVSPQCSATPDGVIELSRFTLGRRGDPVAPRPSQQGYSVRSKFMLQDTTEQQRVTVITLDDPYTPMEWSYKGNAAGRSVSLYLLHPKLATPYLIDTVQLHAITSFSFSSMTMIPSSVVPPLINSAETPEPEDNDDGDNDGNDNNNDNEAPPLKPWDPSLYASVLAYVSPTVYAVLHYVEIIANPYPIRLANQPLLGLGSGFASMYCGDTPCYNGRCVMDDDKKDALPTCQCYGGYTGVFCERLMVCQTLEPPSGDDDAPPQHSMRLPREAELTKKHKYSMMDLPASVTPLNQQQYDAMLDTMQSTATAQCDRQECLHQYFDANCSTCELSCASGRGTPNAQCSACECKQGYVGPQCNCRRVFLPVYHHRAPAFLEEHFSTTKRSTATASPTDIVEVPLTIRAQYNQWKRLVLNDVSLDLTYPVNALDIADFGYHTQNGSTAFVTLVAIDVCSDLVSTKGGVSYRSGNVTDLALASLLLAEYTKPHTQQKPLAGRPAFLASTYRSGDIAPTSADLRAMDDDDGSDTTMTRLSQAQPTPSGVMMSTATTDTPVIQRAHSTASAPLLLQSVYHTPSSIATGVSQVYGSGFVKVVPLIDPACSLITDTTTPAEGETGEDEGDDIISQPSPCYASAEMPKLKKMPYGPASKRPPPVTLILILIFCLVLPLIIILALLFWCWYKSIYLFKPKEEKSQNDDPQGLSKDPSQSGTQLTQYKGGSGKHSGVSMTTASTPHQMEDPDLHPDWKKVMGPAGEPIYINDTTLKSSKVRPLPDGTIPSQRSMFHRPTIFAKK